MQNIHSKIKKKKKKTFFGIKMFTNVKLRKGKQGKVFCDMFDY